MNRMTFRAFGCFLHYPDDPLLELPAQAGAGCEVPHASSMIRFPDSTGGTRPCAIRTANASTIVRRFPRRPRREEGGSISSFAPESPPSGRSRSRARSLRTAFRVSPASRDPCRTCRARGRQRSGECTERCDRRAPDRRRHDRGDGEIRRWRRRWRRSWRVAAAAPRVEDRSTPRSGSRRGRRQRKACLIGGLMRTGQPRMDGGWGMARGTREIALAGLQWRGCSCRGASPSQIDSAHRHAVALRFDVDVAVGRGLHGGDQRVAAALALEAAEFFGGDDDHLVAPVHGDMLRAFAAHAPHQLAEAGLGVLQQPVARQPTKERAAAGLGVFGWWRFLVLVILTRLPYWPAREQSRYCQASFD